MQITAGDLVIRPFEERDTDAFVAAVRESISAVGAWMPWCSAVYSCDEATYSLRTNLEYDLGIFSLESGLLLGGISVNQINQQHNFGNVGYWVRQSQQKKGYASRAVLAISEFGFTKLKLTRLEIVTAVNNLPSKQVAEKVGASFECVARNRLIVFGQPCDAAVYSLVP